MTFVVDAQLPPALARVLRHCGCDAVAVREIGLRDATDSEIWHYAIQRQAAIITKDEDFAERCLYSQNQPRKVAIARCGGGVRNHSSRLRDGQVAD